MLFLALACLSWGGRTHGKVVRGPAHIGQDDGVDVVKKPDDVQEQLVGQVQECERGHTRLSG
jgi:hypothetical protein